MKNKTSEAIESFCAALPVGKMDEILKEKQITFKIFPGNGHFVIHKFVNDKLEKTLRRDTFAEAVEATHQMKKDSVFSIMAA